MSDFGRLRKAGDVTAYNEYGKVGDYAFLFDMVLILCHKPRWLQHRYRFREAIKVKDFFLEPLPHSSAAGDGSGEDVFSVRMFRRVDARKPPLTLISKTYQDRDAWFHTILAAMDSVNPSENASQGHVLQMNTFTEPTECFHCAKVLQGKFFQGYRCLRCQANLHKSCIAHFACLEVGNLKRVDSVTLPTALPDSLERSNSTLSLASSSNQDRKSQPPRMSQQVQEMQMTIQREMESIPLEQQPWFAGQLAAKVASDRLEALPVGTFLVRQRANGLFALMLKTPETPKGVKAMAIQKSYDEYNQAEFYFSGAKKFPTVQKLVSYHRTRDLTDNFDYPTLKGICLKTPYKNL